MIFVLQVAAASVLCWAITLVLACSIAAVWERVRWEWRTREIYREYRRGL